MRQHAIVAGRAERDRVRRVGDGAGADRHRVVRGRGRAGADGGGIRRGGSGIVAIGRAAIRRAGVVADRDRAGGAGIGADGDGVGAGRCRAIADGERAFLWSRARGAEGDGAVAARGRARTDSGGIRAACQRRRTGRVHFHVGAAAGLNRVDRRGEVGDVGGVEADRLGQRIDLAAVHRIGAARRRWSRPRH